MFCFDKFCFDRLIILEYILWMYVPHMIYHFNICPAELFATIFHSFENNFQLQMTKNISFHEKQISLKFYNYSINPLTANFHPLELVSRLSDPQL